MLLFHGKTIEVIFMKSGKEIVEKMGRKVAFLNEATIFKNQTIKDRNRGRNIIQIYFLMTC